MSSQSPETIAHLKQLGAIVAVEGRVFTTSYGIGRACSMTSAGCIGVRVDEYNGKRSVRMDIPASDVQPFAVYAEQLEALTRLTFDGDLISKPHRDFLVRNGLAAKADGFNIITQAGWRLLVSEGYIGKDGKSTNRFR